MAGIRINFDDFAKEYIMNKLGDLEKQQYLDEVVIPNFMPMLNEKIYSLIIGDDYKMKICTNYSAHALGFDNWIELIGKSYQDYQDIDFAQQIFQEAYNENYSIAIHHHAEKIFQIQQYVMSQGKAVNFIDLLPYNNIFKSFLVTYIPIYHPNREIIALQSFATETRFFGFQDHLDIFENNERLSTSQTHTQKLSQREHEVLFLLANGVTQEQSAQILGVSRSTISTLIMNLCCKFDISGSNTKLLSKIAIQDGYYQNIPKTLWKPCVIVLEPELVSFLSAEAQ